VTLCHKVLHFITSFLACNHIHTPFPKGANRFVYGFVASRVMVRCFGSPSTVLRTGSADKTTNHAAKHLTMTQKCVTHHNFNQSLHRLHESGYYFFAASPSQKNVQACQKNFTWGERRERLFFVLHINETSHAREQSIPGRDQHPFPTTGARSRLEGVCSSRGSGPKEQGIGAAVFAMVAAHWV